MPKRPTVRKIKKKENLVQTAFSRFLFIVAIFVIWIGIIGVRLVHLQVNESDWLREKALNQRRDELKSKMLRGSILDRTERTLALSVKVKSLYADPAEIEDVPATAKAVAAALKIKPNEILSNLQEAKDNKKRFVWLARKLDEDAAQKLNETLKDIELKKFDEPRFPGLHWKEEQKRSYPYAALASQVVGFSGLDDIGQAGIEMAQEETLRGAVVKKWQIRDRLGRVYDESETEVREPPKDIVLTLSHSIQYKVEEALSQGVRSANAKSGMAIVLDPKTGEILAMANYPTFDPNKVQGVAPEMFTNKTVQSIYSPGSVFKLVTYGAALQENLLTPEATVDTSQGFIEVAGHRFSDHSASKSMTYLNALAVSSNLAAIKTGLRVGEDRFYNYARRFGFGEMTGIDLPAEARGQLRPPDRWWGDSLASMSIGYEVGVTALQMATAYATVANDGVRVKPHIIKEIRYSDGKVFSRTEPQKTQVISAETARALRRMMREVVLKGTGKRAQLDGYTSAGKTGTAWKYDPKLKKVSSSKYISSFIGFAPADNPSVVIAVILDEPQGGARDGGQVSAPIFHQIATQILPEMNVVPDAIVEQTVAQEIPQETKTKSIEEQPGENKPVEKENKTIEKTSNGTAGKTVGKLGTKFNKEKVSKRETLAPFKPPKGEKKEPAKPLPEEKDSAKPAPNKEKPKNDTKNKSSAERIRIVT